MEHMYYKRPCGHDTDEKLDYIINTEVSNL